MCFNPRARVGRDQSGLLTINEAREFQSTRPRGARLKGKAFNPIVIMFQSTRPRGARLMGSGTTGVACVFQSTRPRGARLACNIVNMVYTIVSIHAPAWGAT